MRLLKVLAIPVGWDLLLSLVAVTSALPDEPSLHFYFYGVTLATAVYLGIMAARSNFPLSTTFLAALAVALLRWAGGALTAAVTPNPAGWTDEMVLHAMLGWSLMSAVHAVVYVALVLLAWRIVRSRSSLRDVAI